MLASVPLSRVVFVIFRDHKSWLMDWLPRCSCQPTIGITRYSDYSGFERRQVEYGFRIQPNDQKVKFKPMWTKRFDFLVKRRRNINKIIGYIR